MFLYHLSHHNLWSLLTWFWFLPVLLNCHCQWGHHPLTKRGRWPLHWMYHPYQLYSFSKCQKYYSLFWIKDFHLNVLNSSLWFSLFISCLFLFKMVPWPLFSSIPIDCKIWWSASSKGTKPPKAYLLKWVTFTTTRSTWSFLVEDRALKDASFLLSMLL
jgi:hypothetical protein